jgi:ech hydrogenase subunit E
MLVQKREFNEFVYIAERICGICSCIHGIGYCEAIEEIMKIEIPPRAKYLRVLWGELSRIHSHLLWLGLAADAFGFENLFMQAWRVRETILDIIEETTGGRVIFGIAKIGGVRRNIEADTLTRIDKILRGIESDVRQICSVFLNDNSVKHRLCGIGVISGEEAYQAGAVGPMLRASGVAYDCRMLGYDAYSDIDFNIVTAQEGDCYARCKVRIGEIFQSFSIISQVSSKMPDSEISTAFKGTPEGEAFVRFEQPRGEVVYFAKGNRSKLLSRFRARTATFANIPAMMQILKGSNFADVPNIILTIDPCISCTER